MLNSVVEGSGYPIVFLHGFGEDLTLWKDLADQLIIKYKVACIDLPGFGKSQAVQGKLTLEDIADTVHQHLANKYDIKEYVVLGHSLGGYITLALAEKYTSSLAGFGLINSSSLEDSDEKKANRLKTIDFINKYGANYFLKSFVPNLFAPASIERLNNKLSLVLEMGKNIPNNVLTSYMEAMRTRPDRSQQLSDYEHVLFIGGREDPQFGAEAYEKQLELLQNKDFGIIIPEIAHMSMFEAPESLYKSVSDFLDSLKKV